MWCSECVGVFNRVCCNVRSDDATTKILVAMRVAMCAVCIAVCVAVCVSACVAVCVVVCVAAYASVFGNVSQCVAVKTTANLLDST